MAQDLRKLFENERNVTNKKMPQGHEDRFLSMLDKEFPQEVQSKKQFSWLQIAASIVVLLGLGYLVFSSLNPANDKPINSPEMVGNTKSLQDVSPQLKKVEDYYLANINLELSKLEYTPENKELFDGYVTRLGELSAEYEKLSNELVTEGPTENTVNSLIDNLKLRLNLLYRLKEKLNELNTEASDEATVL